MAEEGSLKDLEEGTVKDPFELIFFLFNILILYIILWYITICNLMYYSRTAATNACRVL